MKRDLGDRIVEHLQAGGVDAAFGVPGGQTLPLYAAAQRRGFRHVMMRDERAAACAADAYARTTGRVGVCDATVGPGVTNLVSGLAEAHCSSIPVLALVADVATGWDHLRRRGAASQALDQRMVVEGACKWMARVGQADALDDVLAQALRVATTGRPGPVVLEVPDDLFKAESPERALVLGEDDGRYPRFRSAAPASELDEAVALLANAQRPLILAGGGVPISGAAAAVTRLAESTGIPVATSLNGKGAIDERHPLALGVVGVFGNVLASRALARADVVLVLGSKLGQFTSFSWRLPGPDQTVIQVDVDGEEIGRALPLTLGCVADAREAANAIADGLKDRALSIEEGWPADIPREGQPGTRPDDPAVAPEQVVAALDARLGPGDLLLTDASLPSGWGGQHYRVKEAGRGYIAPRGLAGIGWSCGASVGARIGLPREQQLVCLAGDGGFAYSMAEIETAVRQQLSTTYVVLNNACYAWIRHTEQWKGHEPVSDLGNIDFAMAARAMGAEGERVESIEALPEVLDRALASERPFVVDVQTSAEASPTLGMRDIAPRTRPSEGGSYKT